MAEDGNQSRGGESTSSFVRVSPVPSSSVAVAFAPLDNVVATAANKRANEEDDAASATPASKKAKVVSDIQKKVRDLLDKKLMGTDAVKAAALCELAWCICSKKLDDSNNPQREGYLRAVEEWDGCHLVLNALQFELDRAAGPNRQVVVNALSFFNIWNSVNERRDAMSRFNGVELVTRAMKAFPQDGKIQELSIFCLYNFGNTVQAKYRLELIEEDCVPHIIHAMAITLPSAVAQWSGIHLLRRFAVIDGQDRTDLLIEHGALVAVAKAFTTYKESDDPKAHDIREAGRLLMSKLHG